ncbi:Cytochrome p450 [Lasiodiplodia theobromae]|uniref:Cytochrome p450 n=1 Tax=Lasiodiplodia theobromae TaxID=45133 RepID=UPI0015C323A7|nr:Cytochrome p450 [Lasiodiplodia theobromae]KAF4534669.1 Cytochrome p450 [Lasiodiplodia theobromae]
MLEAMENLKIKNGALEQILAKRVLVGYEDPGTGSYQHVGRLSDPQDAEKIKFSLLIGRDVETKQKYIIYFHLPFRTRHVSKKPKNLYLIIPVEQLKMSIDTVSADKLPVTTMVQLKKDDGLEDSRSFLSIRLDLGCSSYAVMPTLSRPMEAPLTGVPGQLLSHFKSLSTVKSLDIYLNDGDGNEELLAFQEKLQTNSLTSPRLDMVHMYEGSLAGTNNWDQYPCGEDVGNHIVWNPVLEDKPPAYDDVVAEPPATGWSDSQNDQSSDHVSFAKSPGGTHSLYWRNRPQPRSKWIRAVDAGQPDADAISRLRSRKRRAVEEPGHADEYLSPGLRTGSPTEPDSSPLAAMPGVAVSMDKSPSPHAQAVQMHEAIIASLYRRNTLGALELDFSLLKKPSLFIELQEWLLKMWEYDHHAHATYARELFKLGSYARLSKLRLFDAAMAELQEKFFKAVTDSIAPWNQNQARADFREQCGGVAEWLRGSVCRNAVMFMAKPLVDLRRAAAVAEREGKGEGGRMRAFYERKAECCAIAFYAFGDVV